jgi:hypothetical protein
MAEADPYLAQLSSIAINLKRIADLLEALSKSSVTDGPDTEATRGVVRELFPARRANDLVDRIRDLEIQVSTLENRSSRVRDGDPLAEKHDLLLRARTAEAMVGETVGEIVHEIVAALNVQGVAVTEPDDNGLVAVTGYLNVLTLARQLIGARFTRESPVGSKDNASPPLGPASHQT